MFGSISKDSPNVESSVPLHYIRRRKIARSNKIPESPGELLDTTIGMMLDNDLSMELDLVFSNTDTIDTKCNCKSACLTKKCVCKEKNIKCKDQCTCNTKKCKNQMEVVSVDLVSLDINPVLSDNESSIYTTLTEDESDSVNEGVFQNSSESTCSGTCIRGCVCKTANKTCVTTECSCNSKKCKNIGIVSNQFYFQKNRGFIQEGNCSEKVVIFEKKLDGIDIDEIGNLEDLPRLVFIDEEFENLILVHDSKEFTRSIKQKKSDILQ